MKCAVAIVLALIGVVVSNPVAPLTGLSWAAPPLLPSAGAVGYGKIITPIIEKVAVPIVKTVPIFKSVPIIKTPVLTPPLSVGYPGYGYGYDLGYGGLGYGGLGYGYGGLGWGNGGLGYGGYGKEWH